MSRLFSGRRASVGPSNTFRRNQSTTGTGDNSSKNTNANVNANTNVTVNSNPSKPNIATAAAAYSPHVETSVQPPSVPGGNSNALSDTEIKGLLNRVETKLPCNSGQRLAVLASDPVLGKAVDGLVDFSPQNGDYVLIGLAKILDKLKRAKYASTATAVFPCWQCPLGKSLNDDVERHDALMDERSRHRTRTLPDGTVPDQVLDSQLFILKIMNRVMGRRHSFENASSSSSSSHSNPLSLPPPPLDTQTLLYLVYVLWTCLPSHIICNIAKHRWPRHVVEREPGLGGGHKGSLPSAAAPSLPILEPTPSPEAMYAHSYTQDEALHGLYFASVPVLISKYTTRLFYYLSAYNWTTIHLLFTTRLRLIVDGVISINNTQILSANPRTVTTSFLNNNTSASSNRPAVSGKSTSTSSSKPGSSAGLPSSALSNAAYSSSASNSHTVIGNIGSQAYSQAQFARYNLVPTPSTSNVSFLSGASTVPYGGVGDTVERTEMKPEREREKSGISVGVNLLKKGRAEKERERELERERGKEKEREKERANATNLRILSTSAVADSGSSNGFAFAGGHDSGPGSPRGFVPSTGSGPMHSTSMSASSSSLGPGNLNLTVPYLANLPSPAFGGSGGGVGQGIGDMVFKIISVSMLDSSKLLDIFGDLIKSFPQLPNDAQDQAGILIRDLIINFSEACPSEFWRVWGVVIEGGGGGSHGDGRNGSIDLARPVVGNLSANEKTPTSSANDISALAERLYDLIWDMVGANRRLSSFYAPLAALLCLIPKRFEANLEVMEGKNSGKKNTFFKHLSQAIRSRPSNSNSTSSNSKSVSAGTGGGGGLGTLFGFNTNSGSYQHQTSSPSEQHQQPASTAPIPDLTPAAAQLIMMAIPDPPLQAHELAAQAVLDIMRLGYSIPSLAWLSGREGVGRSGGGVKGEDAFLRAAACEVFGGVLKDFMFHNPLVQAPFFQSPDPIDVDFYVYCIVALFRLWPENVLQDVIMVCLEPEKSYAVKYVAVKAVVLLLVEQSKYPYQPKLDFVWPAIVSRIRSLFISCVSASPEIIEGTARTVSPTPICRTLWRSRAYAQALGISSNPASTTTSPSNPNPSSSGATGASATPAPNPVVSTHSSVHTSTSGFGIPLPGVIKEELRLFVIIVTLFPIELKSWLYGVVPDDHVHLMRRAASSLEPHRDKRDPAAAVMALRTCVNACVDAGPDVKEGLDFLIFSVPGAFVNSCVILTTCFEELDLIRSCITGMHSIISRMVAFTSDDRDNVWRVTPLLKSVIDFVEFTLYISLPSNQQDISCYAQQCLRLLSVYEHHPLIGKPPNLTESQWAKRTAFLESFDNPRNPPNVSMGRVAFQKRVRKLMQQIPSITSVHIMAFKEMWFRFSKLTPRFSEPGFNSFSSQKDREDLQEWQHLTYLLATCIYKDMEDNVPSYPAELMPMLPPRLTSGARISDMCPKFIAECVRLLASDNVQVREFAKEALSMELNLNCVSLLFEQLDKDITAQLGGGSGLEGIIPSTSSTLVFIDQCLFVFKANFERLTATVTAFDNNAPSNLLQIGRFIARLSPSSSTSTINLNGNAVSTGTISSSGSMSTETTYLRLRSKFCMAVGQLLGKRQFFAIREEMAFRSQLCDILISWLDEHVDGTPPPGELKLSNDAFLGVLKLFTTSLENLRLQADNFPMHVLPVNVNSDPEQIIAQKARHYITSLTKALKVQEAPAGSVINLSLDSLSSQDDAPVIQELVIAGISYLLQNNPKATKLHCLAGCYDSNVLLRVVYMKAFTRVLALGTKLDVTQGKNSNEESNMKDDICRLLRNSDLVTFAAVEACPPNEGENIIPILIRLYDTPERLLTFLKATINREITKTESPASLLRVNTLFSRIITSFARHHGYTYLRNSIRYLVDLMLDQTDHPEDSSFEIEPSKLRPNENLETNIALVLDVVKKFLEYLIGTVDSLPKSIRQVCHHIAETVSTTWPESKYPALGAFVFLRFLCPTIVAPENVNITGYEYNIHVRRGLVTVAKILQSMSNQIAYGREPQYEPINFFLLENSHLVLRFLQLIQESDTEAVVEETVNLYPGASETDILVLHRFLQTHADQIGQQLLDSKDSTALASQTKGRNGGGMTMTAKQAWDTLCALLVDTKSRLEVPKLSKLDESHHTAFQNFMRRNYRRNTDSVADTFKIDSIVDGAAILVFTWTKIDMDVVDFELLVYHIFKKLTEPSLAKLKIDMIFDFTGFTPRSQLPTAWIKLLLELLPVNIRKRWRRIYVLNINTEALAFIRKVNSLFHGLDLAQEIILTPTFAELKSWFENVPDLMEDSLPAMLELNEVTTFQNVHYQIEQQLWTSANVYIGADHIRIVSVTPEKLHSEYVAYLVEVIHLRDIDDVFRGANQQRITLRQYHSRPIMMFELAHRDPLLKAIQKAKRMYAANNRTPLLPSAQTSDTCATLLAIGLLHASDKTEFVRGAAYKLLDANCAYLGYPFDALVPWKSSFFPTNPFPFIIPFSDRIAGFSPSMTLDFIFEWHGGLANATPVQKSISLQYIAPWIRNLDLFVDPTHSLYDAPGLRKCLRVFVDFTMQDQEMYATFQKMIWSELAKLSEPVLDILLEELIQVALNDGLDSLRCELVADTLVAFSSLPIRTRVLNQLREVCSTVLSLFAELDRRAVKVMETVFDKPIAKIMETTEWKSIAVLSRLSLAAGHGMHSRDANQQRAGEIAYVITMLAGVGSVTMRISVHGMALNLLQTLFALHAENEAIGMQLRSIIDELNSAEYLKLFGLCRPYPSADIILTSSETQVTIDDLEKITKILLRALLTGATSVGVQNVWKVRWVGELSRTAFQSSPYAQYRAFVVLGALAEIETEEHHLYQWLKVLKRSILADNVDSLLAILRSLSNVVRTLGARPKVPASLFWLGIAILHTGSIPLRAEALRLLKACVETLDKHNVFKDFEADPNKNPVESVLMEAREALGDAAVRLEVLSEVSFEKTFGWALVAMLYKNIRTRNDSNITKDVVMSMLRIAMRCSPGSTNEERKALDSLTMPLLLATAPCYDRRSYERFLEQECYIVDPFRAMTDGTGYARNDDDYHLNADLLGIHTSQDAMLAFTFFLVTENNNINGVTSTEHLHFLWAELAKSFPDECTWAVWHFKEIAPAEWMQKKYESAFSTGMSDAHTKAVAACFDLMIARVANATPEGTPNASATSLPQSISDQDSPSAIFLSKMTALGLHGLWKPLLRFANIEPPVPPEKTKKLRTATADLIDLIRP